MYRFLQISVGQINQRRFSPSNGVVRNLQSCVTVLRYVCQQASDLRTFWALP